jgi:F0F1-type ATP synthase epsilon subunit
MSNTDPTQPTTLPRIADSATSIRLMIRNRKKILFDDEVKAMTSFNDKGVFDVLPHHENFISVIREYIIIRKKDSPEEKMKIENGILKVKNNQINCYIDLLAKIPTTAPHSPVKITTP